MINIKINYHGLISKITGKEEEIFSLSGEAVLSDLMEQVFNRYNMLKKQRRSLFIALNCKPVSPVQKDWQGQQLRNDDQLFIGVKVVGG